MLPICRKKNVLSHQVEEKDEETLLRVRNTLLPLTTNYHKPTYNVINKLTFYRMKSITIKNVTKKAFTLLLLSPFLFVPVHAQSSGTHTENDSLRTERMIRNGSVDQVTEDRMNKGLVTNPISALSGQAAGVNVSNADNRMAMLSSVRVRGTTSLTGGNDPLVVIDGVTADLATLSSIYPADIESFTILKNASETAQYGSRGASGVIQVKTKTGHGGQFHISYDGNIGFQSVYKNIDMLDRAGYIQTAKDLGLYYNDGGFDTDFPSAITRTGVVQNHHVAFSGGTEQSNYRASVGLMDHQTVIRDRSFNNFVAKLDLTQKAFDDRLTIDLGVFGSSQRNKYIVDQQDLFYSAAAQNPTYSEGMTDGAWKKNTTALWINHPFAVLQKKDHDKMLSFNSHLQLAFDILPGLKATAFGSYSFNSTENMQYFPTWVWAQGQAYRGEKKAEDWLANLKLDYSHTWGIHQLQLTAMGEYQQNNLSGFYTTVRGFTTNNFGYDNLMAGALRPYGGTGSSYEKPILVSFMAGAKYTLMDRYTLSVNARYDGSSMMGENDRWGFFPSISGEWDIKKEPFMANVYWLTQLKLRSGYGVSGNLGGIASFYSLQMLQPTGVVPLNGASVVTLGYTQNANPDLRWESRSSFNIGVDLGVWNNRLVMTAEYYYSKTTDMLYMYDVSVPPFAYNKLLANLGSMSNGGFELGMGITPLQTKDIELNVNVNMSWQRNKLISLSGYYQDQYITADNITPIGSLSGAGFHGNSDVVFRIVGEPLGVFYLPHCKGLEEYADGGKYYDLEDADGDGTPEKHICGQATPKMTLGSNISFRYKRFDMSLQMNGAFGHKIYNGTANTYMNMGSFPDYNVMKGAPEQHIYDQTPSDYWLESGNYLNFDYLTLGYNVPIRSRFISSLRLSLSVNNLGTITSYSGLTPMINSFVVNNTLGVDDKRTYPVYRSYSMGVSISF